MKPIDDKFRRDCEDGGFLYYKRTRQPWRQNKKSITPTLGLDTWESKHLFQSLTAGRIQRGRGYVCVDWSQEGYEPLVS